MSDKSVKITIKHPSCNGCEWERSVNDAFCHGCYFHKAPMEHQNYKPRRVEE